MAEEVPQTPEAPPGFRWVAKPELKVDIDSKVSHLRSRVGALRRAGRNEEADIESRRLRARNLLLTAQKAMAVEPALLPDEVDLIVAVLRGGTTGDQS